MNKKQLVAAWVIGMTAIFSNGYGSLCYSQQHQNFQFEDYKWGTPIAEARKQVESKNILKEYNPPNWSKRLEEINNEFCVIPYMTELFDRCKITLRFTKRTKILYAVAIHWFPPEKIKPWALQEKILQTLTDKYGKPTETIYNQYAHSSIYRWKKDIEELEFSEYGESVTYKNAVLSLQAKKENEENERSKINEKDTERF